MIKFQDYVLTLNNHFNTKLCANSFFLHFILADTEMKWQTEWLNWFSSSQNTIIKTRDPHGPKKSHVYYAIII